MKTTITESTSTPKMVPNPRAIPLSIACIVDVPNNTVCADKGISMLFQNRTLTR